MPKENSNSSTPEPKPPHFLARMWRSLTRSQQSPLIPATPPVLAEKEKQDEIKPEEKIVSSTWNTLTRSMTAGSVSSGVEALVNHPFLILKTRAQLGLSATLNPRVLWQGTIADVVSQAPITIIQVSIDRLAKHWLFKDGDLSHSQRVGVGFFAGAFSALAGAPTEAGITYMETTKKGFIISCKMLIEKRGISALYAGIFETMLRDGGASAAYLAGHPIAKRWITSLVTDKEKTEISAATKILISMTSGASVGLFAALATQPADAVKTMRQKAAQTHHLSIQAAWKELGKNGIKGYGRGGFWRAIQIMSGTTILGEIIESIENRFKSPTA